MIHRYHVSEKTLKVSMSRAVENSRLAKRTSVYTLRHSFATHLLMQGGNNLSSEPVPAAIGVHSITSVLQRIGPPGVFRWTK